MKPISSKSTSIRDILLEYRDAATSHRDATRTGNYRLANRQVKVLVNCYREVRARGEEAKKEFLTLVQDPDEAVRLWAAAHALEFAPKLAEAALEELEAGGTLGVIRTSAHYTLEEWRSGTLNFP